MYSNQSVVVLTEDLVEISLGNFDAATFSKQTVEIVLVLSAACRESFWYKDGRRVAAARVDDDGGGGALSAPTTAAAGGVKYTASIDDDGIVHTLVVDDVGVPDGGIYTFRVPRSVEEPEPAVAEKDGQPTAETAAVSYRLEGSEHSANVTALMRGFEREVAETTAGSESLAGSGGDARAELHGTAADSCSNVLPDDASC